MHRFYSMAALLLLASCDSSAETPGATVEATVAYLVEGFKDGMSGEFEPQAGIKVPYSITKISDTPFTLEVRATVDGQERRSTMLVTKGEGDCTFKVDQNRDGRKASPTLVIDFSSFIGPEEQRDKGQRQILLQFADKCAANKYGCSSAWQQEAALASIEDIRAASRYMKDTFCKGSPSDTVSAQQGQ